MTLEADGPSHAAHAGSVAPAGSACSARCRLNCLLCPEPAAQLQVVLGLSIKEATVLSQAAIAGGSLSGAIFALFRGHPEDARMPLLDFRLALVLMPVLLLGTSVGAHA